MRKKRCTAVVLAAGSGSRMGSSVPKQFLELGGRPMICHALEAVQRSAILDDCILVTGAADILYMRCEIVEKYGFSKVEMIIAGGGERYESVANALDALENGEMRIPNRDGYVFIHDGARPFLSEKLLEDTYAAAYAYGACVAAVPSKDTVKLADGEGYAAQTPNRDSVWMVQTPQVFETPVICEAYRRLMAQLPLLRQQDIQITDDAMVVETMLRRRVKLVPSFYGNIKVTTPEDMVIAEALLKGG
ncbi:MAG: 2-C-methyl-D-erythritol 4-phosphate cytidylyltransferase [Lachnospiraceae bacterium]|nr:2-C-methyl-D-erythritol 4-phosphate cytidylyltransferase [Lachnospiraceae bacterium]